jgi:pyruvate,water dikinase
MMKNILATLAILVFAQVAVAQAKVMNAGQAIGQLIILSATDVTTETPKYKALSPLSIPMFAELPLDMSVVAGAITMKQQNLLSHVQLKSRARKTPNLDISMLEGGMQNPLLSAFADGDWINMTLGADGSISITAATEAEANAFYQAKRTEPVQLRSDVTISQIRPHAELGSEDYVTVGSKAANYAELAKVLNTADRVIVRTGYGIPFYYYEEFIDTNPKIKGMIASILRDPLMNKLAKTSYREAKLKALQDAMKNKDAVVNEKLVDELLAKFETYRSKNLPRNMKLRSSTNSEDLPNFNGAGLYSSESYKPTKNGKEKDMGKKRESAEEALRSVWSSVWNLRAYDERNYFQIPHAQVKIGVQVNPTFSDEGADGVVVTKNMAKDSRFPGAGIYIEVQRGSEHSVANPEAGVKPQKVLVLVDENDRLNVSAYKIEVLQNSNIADDNKTVLPQDNPNPVMKDSEIKDLALQVMKAHVHFKPLLGADKPDFSLDLEFKVDSEDTGARQVYIKQARPYID